MAVDSQGIVRRQGQPVNADPRAGARPGFGGLITALGLGLSALVGGCAQPNQSDGQVGGVDSAAASGAQAEGRTGRTVYVGQEGCDDAGLGARATPFCSFSVAVRVLGPGDTLIIRPGTYQQRIKATGLSGNVGAPITIRGEAASGVVLDGGCPRFPCGIQDVDRDEWWGLVQWGDIEGMVQVTGSRHIVLRDLTVRNVIASGVTIEGGGAITLTHITVDGTGNTGFLIEQTSDITAVENDVGRTQLGYLNADGEAQPGIHEALSVVAVQGFDVAFNRVHDTLKEGIDVKESSADGSVHHNTVERACAVGIYVNEAHRVRVHSNSIRASGYVLDDVQFPRATGSAGRELLCGDHPFYGPFFDRYYGTAILLAVGDLGEASRGALSNISLYRNVAWQAHGNGLQFWDEWRESGTGAGDMWDNRVVNNVFYDTDLGGIRLDAVRTTLVANNILALNNEDGITGDAATDAAAANTVSSNLFQLSHPWQVPVGERVVVGNPLFVDPAAGDFHLQPDSPAIDRGIDVGLPHLGTAPDIGAHEFAVGRLYLPTSVLRWAATDP